MTSPPELIQYHLLPLSHLLSAPFPSPHHPPPTAAAAGNTAPRHHPPPVRIQRERRCHQTLVQRIGIGGEGSEGFLVVCGIAPHVPQEGGSGWGEDMEFKSPPSSFTTSFAESNSHLSVSSPPPELVVSQHEDLGDAIGRGTSGEDRRPIGVKVVRPVRANTVGSGPMKDRQDRRPH